MLYTLALLTSIVVADYDVTCKKVTSNPESYLCSFEDKQTGVIYDHMCQNDECIEVGQRRKDKRVPRRQGKRT